jgi:hypothetical protein
VSDAEREHERDAEHQVTPLELFGGLLATAVKLVGERRLGLEETAATTTALFLDGARLP